MTTQRKAKPAKTTKPVAKATARAKRLAPDAKVRLLTKENPHREGTRLHKLWSLYKTGMTVQAALDAGIPAINLRYLAARKIIALGRGR